MKQRGSFPNSLREEQLRLAERELGSFLRAVTELYGPAHARLSADDWLDEAEMKEGSPGSDTGYWRALTIAASVQLAKRVDAKSARARAARRLQC